MGDYKKDFKAFFASLEEKLEEMREEDTINEIITDLQGAVHEATDGNGNVRMLKAKFQLSREKMSELKLSDAGMLYDLEFSYNDGNSILEDCTRRYRIFSVFLERKFPVVLFPRTGDPVVANNPEAYFEHLKTMLKADETFKNCIGRARAFVKYDRLRKAEERIRR